MILHVQAIEACNLPDMDIIGKSDPYLKFKFDFSNKIWKTQYKIIPIHPSGMKPSTFQYQI